MQFTINDLLSFAAPCRNCGGKASINLCGGGYAGVKCKVKNNGLRFDMIRYNSPISFWIDPKTHKYKLSTNGQGIEYINKIYNNEYSLLISCHNCFSFIEAGPFFIYELEDRLPALNIIREKFILFQHEGMRYSFSSEEKENLTIFYFYDPFKNKQNEVKLPYFPLYNFRNREEILRKIKLLLAFQ